MIRIYAKESEYNSEYWMDHNPAMFIRINFVENGMEYRGGNIRIIGTMTKEDVFDRLEKADVDEFRIIEDE